MVIKFILIFISIPVILFLFVRYFEQKSLYYPFSSIDATPKDINLEYEDVTTTTADGIEIHGWFIPAEAPAGVLLFSHGNGGNISHRLEKVQMLHDIGFDILIYDYRGYGRSRGKPSETGLYMDGEAMYAYLINDRGYEKERIIAYGESLGGAVATELATTHQIKGLILEGSFSSIRDVAAHYFPFIPSVMLKTKFDSLEKIKDIAIPKLIMHSTDDEVIPFKFSVSLFEHASDPKEFIILKGGHNDSFLVSRETYVSEIRKFLSRL